MEKFAQPRIVVRGSMVEYENLSIVIEGKEFCTISSNSCIDAVIALLASFYIFNIDYCQTKSALCFLQTVLFGNTKDGGQLPIRVSSFFNSLS